MSVPDWFQKNISEPHISGFVDVDGCKIHYIKWECKIKSKNKPQGLLLVPGAKAHAHWFVPIAPFLTSEFEVVTMSNSGNGDSGQRDEYNMARYGEEVIAVARYHGFFDSNRSGKPIIVGHSQGGFVSLKLARKYADLLGGMVIADCGLRSDDYYKNSTQFFEALNKPKIVQEKHFPMDVSVHSRFRLVPAQPCKNQYYLDYIAQYSIKVNQETQTWTWKFDYAIDKKFIFWREADAEFAAQALKLNCRIGFINGAKSAEVDQTTHAYMSAVLGKDIPLVSIPEAYHHLFLDEPIAFISALTSMLLEWRRSSCETPSGVKISRGSEVVTTPDPTINFSNFYSKL